MYSIFVKTHSKLHIGINTIRSFPQNLFQAEKLEKLCTVVILIEMEKKYLRRRALYIMFLTMLFNVYTRVYIHVYLEKVMAIEDL